MHKATKIVWLTALTLAAGCAEAGTSPEPGEGQTPDFRDGTYHYVLGFDEHTGEQLRGGAHMVVTFDDEGKTEAIDSANRTSQFHPDLQPNSEYAQFDASLTEGETDWDVFASTWWPMSNNGTAWRWQPGANQDYNDRSDVDTLSPMEKYDLLFYPGQEETVPATSNCAYADYADDPAGCEKTEHPELTVAGPATKWEMQNQGNYQWVQPENWWGHCNGWASYATSEPMGYPHRDISVKMVEGKVTECIDDTEGCMLWKMADVEALFTELHFSDKATFTGRRCRTAADEIERDEFGRPTDVSCRDLNPGSFHIAITGMLGRGARNLATNQQGRPSFVIDHTADYEVWNFPINAFNATYEDITAERANELIGAAGSDYEFNDDAASFQRVRLNYSMISDGVPENELLKRADTRDVDPHWVELNYVLEIDGSGRIIGGEWIDDPTTAGGPNNQELHPDFAWMAVDAVGWGEGSDDTGGDNDNPYIALSKARALLQCANEPDSCAPPPVGDGEGESILDVTDVAADDQTRSFTTEELAAGEYVVTLAHTEANPGGDADLYVRVGQDATMADYDCRPFEAGSDEVCTITLTAASRIHMMVHGYPGEGDSHFRLTVTGDGEGGTPEPEAWGGMNESGTVVADEETRFSTPDLPVGSYSFELSGDGDADLYVRVGEAPDTTTYDCRPYLNGSQELCTVTLSAPGPVHVMVRGWADSSTWELAGAVQ
ncbi:MAG: hypothetical protein K0V04_16885 [Deltaproteobacteria bacterium]|nr:hypothetical protein [Deltaproteobacteria bacterium]